MNPFKQRSSIPSSLLTALVGWLGFMFIGPLIFGFRMPSETLFLIGLCSALIQVIFLRLLFFPLQMHRHLLIGAFWGLASAIAMYFATAQLIEVMADNQFYWLLIYAYIGAPVGGFLSYFYRDDKKIFDALGGKTADTDFGRDAHWLEPFAFGALAYLLAFVPFSSVDLFVNVFIVGAISGVAAAGASHFSPDKWKKSWGLLACLIIILGCLQGFLTGLLLRSFTEELFTSPSILGMIGAVMTYLATFARGRYLAAKEENEA